MSIFIPSSEVSDEDIQQWERDLTIETEVAPPRQKMVKKWRPPSPTCCVLRVHRQKVDDLATVAIPFAYATRHAKTQQHRPLRTSFPAFVDATTDKPKIQPRPEQKEIMTETIQVLQAQKGSVCISVYPGGGKTFMALCLARRIGLRTLILTHRIVLMQQWRETVEKCFPGIVCPVLSTSTRPEEFQDASICISNALTVPKSAWAAACMQSFGTVIVDECHLMVSKVLVQALTFVAPRYLIGLSATPYRPDGLDKLLQLYFGGRMVVRELRRQHACIRFDTDVEAPQSKTERGETDWNAVLAFQATDEARNTALVSVCLKACFSGRNMLVLCKRRDHCDLLASMFQQQGESSVSCFYGTQTTFDKECRVLISTFPKVGVGFSHERLDMLVLAADAQEYFLQYLGRVFRRPDTEPVVIDAVDQHPLLHRHWLVRQRVYKKSGGSIIPLATFEKANTEKKRP